MLVTSYFLYIHVKYTNINIYIYWVIMQFQRLDNYLINKCFSNFIIVFISCYCLFSFSEMWVICQIRYFITAFFLPQKAAATTNQIFFLLFYYLTTHAQRLHFQSWICVRALLLFSDLLAHSEFNGLHQERYQTISS